ncbi:MULTISPECIES: hypothetical protein [unclassified Streptomyces]|uniref:hypothetical protein n=1 Tax=unclassified Streptomyces TaxID=2593676 RepID=UPI0034475EEF
MADVAAWEALCAVPPEALLTHALDDFAAPAYPLGPSTASSLCGHLGILLDTLRPEPAPDDLALLRPLLAARTGGRRRAGPEGAERRVEAACRRFAYRVADAVFPGDPRESAAFAWRY